MGGSISGGRAGWQVTVAISIPGSSYCRGAPEQGTSPWLLPTRWLSPCMPDTAVGVWMCEYVHEWVNVRQRFGWPLITKKCSPNAVHLPFICHICHTANGQQLFSHWEANKCTAETTFTHWDTTHTQTCIHRHTHKHANVDTHTHTCLQWHVHTQTHTHTHTHTCCWSCQMPVSVLHRVFSPQKVGSTWGQTQSNLNL